jgi:hypothetical protein
MISFTLPVTAAVTLSVYDVEGRRIATPLVGEPETAGIHELELKTDGWPPGIYLYRLTLPQEELTRKMFVTR